MKKPGFAGAAALPQILVQRDQQRTQGDYSKVGNDTLWRRLMLLLAVIMIMK